MPTVSSSVFFKVCKPHKAKSYCMYVCTHITCMHARNKTQRVYMKSGNKCLPLIICSPCEISERIARERPVYVFGGTRVRMSSHEIFQRSNNFLNAHWWGHSSLNAHIHATTACMHGRKTSDQQHINGRKGCLRALPLTALGYYWKAHSDSTALGQSPGFCTPDQLTYASWEQQGLCTGTRAAHSEFTASSET